MKKLIFNIRTYKGKLEEREGYAFESDGLCFAVSKPIANVCRWVVTELSSGAIFYEGRRGETRKACIQGAKDRIEKYSAAECRRRIAKYIKLYSDAGEANPCKTTESYWKLKSARD